MYRYRDNDGSTRTSVARANKHISKVGKITCIRGYVYFGKHSTYHTAVLVKGTAGSARFSGFSWGYDGEGPTGLRTVLKSLGILNDRDILRIATLPKWPNFNESCRSWQINFDNWHYTIEIGTTEKIK